MSGLRIPVGPDDHVLGDLHAPVVLLEYGDYQCPYCAAAQPVIGDILRDFGDRIAFVFRNFPLSDDHPEAIPAAVTAEYAGNHGRFWEAHDALYANQDVLGDALYEQIASDLGLSVAGLQDAMADDTYLERIQHDFAGGVRSGVNGTPCFFINGRRYDAVDGAEGLYGDIEALLGD
ncbi:DsbA family protein [Xanthomonas massiliensis]|jgi:protein-disulfide isomerase|uniref:DsbA family protein n=1 Tax=Xanthomonas massiliensis TaxID=1720302 RepID=UPI00082708ED|nr:thioredoxin domain-containing protein [Xanthomonas massiliensis]